MVKKANSAPATPKRSKELVNKFARVKSSEYEDYGLQEGDLVFIGGSGFAPVDDEDNYRLLFVAFKTDDSGAPLTEKGITMARKSLGVNPEDDQSELLKGLQSAVEEQGQKEEAPTVH